MGLRYAHFPMLVLFLITFVNLLGFGLIIPLLPFYIERVGGGPEIITLVIALYSLLQFLTAPTIGRLSDRYGRRPVLIWTTAGVILSHVLLGFADSLWLVILARMIGGIAAGNVGVIFAYVADISSGADRAKFMGYLGAAFSLGFMFGPVIGGVLAGTEVETANFMLPAFSAAGLTAVAWLCLLTFLPESLKPEYRSDAAGTGTLPLSAQLRTAFANRHVHDAVDHRVAALCLVVGAVVDLRAVDEPRARTRAAGHRPDLHVLGIYRRGVSAHADRAADQTLRRGGVAHDHRGRDGRRPVGDGGCDDSHGRAGRNDAAVPVAQHVLAGQFEPGVEIRAADGARRAARGVSGRGQSRASTRTDVRRGRVCATGLRVAVYDRGVVDGAVCDVGSRGGTAAGAIIKGVVTVIH